VQLRNLPAAVFLLSCIFLSGQTPPAGDGQPTPTIRSNTREVIEDIVVTDSKGAQVTGLHQSDFQIFEDHKPQTIGFFEEHSARALPPGAAKPLPAMPPNVFTNVPPAPESDAVNVLLLDTLNTPEQDFTYARNQVIQFLHNVPPGTRMAIVSLSDKLTFVQGFTTDASTLLAAVEKKKTGAKPETSSALVSRSEEAANNATLAFRSQTVAGYSTGMASLGVDAAQRAFTEYQNFARRNRTLMTLEALKYLAQYLANVPGRKNLIWFSSSFPVYIFPNLSERGEMQDLVEPVSDARKTADALTAARIAVYPVNARGVMNDESFLADSRGIGNTPTIGQAGSMSPMSSFTADAAQRSETIAEMKQLASDTGGKAIYNNNDLNAATQRAIADGSHYYTLTYSPTNKKLDGNYREIDVKVAGGKYKLSYRRGYNADDPNAEAPKPPANPLQPMMRLGMPDATEILYGLRVVPAATQPVPGAPRAGRNDKLVGPVTRYSVDFMIRWTDIRLTPMTKDNADKQWGRIQLEMLAYDPTGKAVNWAGATQEMQLNQATYASIQRSGIPAHLEIDVPRGNDLYLTTGVYDWRTGKIGTLTVQLPAPDAAASPAPDAR
jgi:VWFA-related protein